MSIINKYFETESTPSFDCNWSPIATVITPSTHTPTDKILSIFKVSPKNITDKIKTKIVVDCSKLIDEAIFVNDNAIA